MAVTRHKGDLELFYHSIGTFFDTQGFAWKLFGTWMSAYLSCLSRTASTEHKPPSRTFIGIEHDVVHAVRTLRDNQQDSCP